MNRCYSAPSQSSPIEEQFLFQLRQRYIWKFEPGFVYNMYKNNKKFGYQTIPKTHSPIKLMTCAFIGVATFKEACRIFSCFCSSSSIHKWKVNRVLHKFTRIQHFPSHFQVKECDLNANGVKLIQHQAIQFHLSAQSDLA